MKYALAIALSCLPPRRYAATPEENYLAARDAFIAKLNPPGDPVAPTDAAIKDDGARARRARQAHARPDRPAQRQGVLRRGAYSVGSLFKGDMEFGILDGLLFTRGKDVRLVVTTTGLAERWIRSPDGLAARKAHAPKDMRAALKLDDFYTRATIEMRAVGNMGELPVTKPPASISCSRCCRRDARTSSRCRAEEMLIGVIAPPRVYIVSAPIAKIKMMAPCEKLFKDADARADRMSRPTRSRRPRRKASATTPSHAREGRRGHAQVLCQRVKSDPAFARATKQAQDFVDALAAK